MAALTFTTGPLDACGNHWTVTVHLGGQSLDVPIQYPDLRVKMSKHEKEEFARQLLRFLVSEYAGGASMAAVRNKLATASITMSL